MPHVFENVYSLNITYLNFKEEKSLKNFFVTAEGKSYFLFYFNILADKEKSACENFEFVIRLYRKIMLEIV